VRLDAPLDWRPFDIPGGSAPVEIVRLHNAQPTLAVRFPPGWERYQTGSYAASEEFIVVDGSIEMNEEIYAPGSWAFVPAGATRRGTSAPAGALTLARFTGDARWTPGVGADLPSIVSGRIDASPDGSEAWPLRAGSWVVRRPPNGVTTPCDLEVVSLTDRAWAFVPVGAAMPAFGAPLFCRTITS
jgi:hypothetical protein